MQIKSFKFILVTILLFWVSLLLLACSTPEESPDDNSEQQADLAPDFTLQDLNGNKVILSELRGSRVLLTFWRLDCPYCLRELPEIEDVYAARSEGNFYILAINPADSKEEIRQFMQDNGYTFPVLLDDHGNVSRQYRVRGVPTNIVVGEDGQLLHTKLGAMNEMELRVYVGLD